MRKYLALTSILVFATAAFAQHDHGHAAAPKPQMDPAIMEAMMKAGTPGPEHKMLDGMVGTWNTKLTMWMMPGADPIGGEGISESKWIFGGRYVEQRFKGSMMGMPFEGLGYSGYDNVKKQYFGTWMDNTGTAMMVSTGKMGADGKMTFTGTMADPMTGKDAPFEERITVIDADHSKFEMWSPGPDGAMYKMMEIAYSRKK